MRKKNGFVRRMLKDIWSRMNFLQKIKKALGKLKQSLADLISDKVFAKIEKFIYEKGFCGSANKIVDICRKEGVDPRYYLVNAVPPEERYDFAKALGFETEYEDSFECPECYVPLATPA